MQYSDVLPSIVGSIDRTERPLTYLKPKQAIKRQKNNSMFEHSTLAINNTSKGMNLVR